MSTVLTTRWDLDRVKKRVKDGLCVKIEIIPELHPGELSEKMNDNKQSLDYLHY